MYKNKYKKTDLSKTKILMSIYSFLNPTLDHAKSVSRLLSDQQSRLKCSMYCVFSLAFRQDSCGRRSRAFSHFTAGMGLALKCL